MNISTSLHLYLPGLTSKLTYREHDLVAQLKQHNKQACGYLYDTYAPALYTCVLQIVKDEEVAAKVTADIFLSICREIAQYDASRERLFTWLSKFARRVALHEMRLRDEHRRNRHDEGGNFTTPKEAYVLMDHCGLRAVVHTLNTEQAALINFCYFEGLTYEQVAEKFHMSAETIQLKVHSALKELNYLLSKPA